MGMGPWRCRLKDLFEFAQGLGARESWLADPGLAAGHDVQHPERHFQNPRCLDVFQAAVHHRPAAFYESGIYPYCPAVPRMPGIADFTEISNMGVVLLTCIMAIERMLTGRTPLKVRGQKGRILDASRTGYRFFSRRRSNSCHSFAVNQPANPAVANRR